MMTWIFAGMIIFSVILGGINGRIDIVSTAAINESTKAVELVIMICGMICLWSGLMKVADKAKLTEKVSILLSPITKRLFKGIDYKSPAGKAISMNITANLFGLGNAATPLGIMAMKEMEKCTSEKHIATNNMVTFIVLNTASLQLVPTTTAMLRLQAGSAQPLSIIPAVWISSIVSVISGLTMSFILSKIFTYKPVKISKPCKV